MRFKTFSGFGSETDFRMAQIRSDLIPFQKFQQGYFLDVLCFKDVF